MSADLKIETIPLNAKNDDEHEIENEHDIQGEKFSISKAEMDRLGDIHV
jgi:hypothetical protein